MPFGWSTPRLSAIALDFGLDSLKALQIQPGDSPTLTAAASLPVPEEARSEPTLRMAFYSDSLRKLLAAAPFKGRKVICAIPAMQTLVQHVQVSRADGEDLATQTGLILRQKLNLDPSRLVMRHVLAGPVMRDGVSKQEVICMAASRDTVMRYLALINAAKLEATDLQCEPTAILSAFAHLYRRQGDEERTTCFLDIGAGTTKVIIAHGHNMVFAKHINVAGDHFTRAIAQARRMSFDEARTLRITAPQVPDEPAPQPIPLRRTIATGVDELDTEVSPTNLTASLTGIGSGTATAPLTAPGITAAASARLNAAGPPPIAADTLECLIDEVQMCIRYHQSLFPGRVIEKLVFIGGEARQVKVCQKIARAVKIGAQLGDPLARLVRPSSGATPAGLDMRQAQPGWAVPMGLCLMSAQETR